MALAGPSISRGPWPSLCDSGLKFGLVWGVLEFIRFLGVSAENRFLVKVLLAFGVIAGCYYLAHRQPKPGPTNSPPSEPPR